MLPRMLDELHVGAITVRGVSLAGVYTSLQIPELRVLLDAGLPIRSFAATDHLFLSHTHGDHAGGLVPLLGIRELIGKRAPKVFLPAEAEGDVESLLALAGRTHHSRTVAELIPMRPGDRHTVGRDLDAVAFRTHHSAPSLGYAFTRGVTKLRPEFAHLSGEEIGKRRQAGDTSLFERTERVELAYATDTLADVLDTEPSLATARVLILECTYLDERRTVADARERMHLHLDELIERAELFENEAIVLMHFSQIYSPDQVRRILAGRLPERLRAKVLPFLPERDWFG